VVEWTPQKDVLGKSRVKASGIKEVLNGIYEEVICRQLSCKASIAAAEAD